MTKSEEICKKLGNLYFFKELVKSNLIYITDEKQEKVLVEQVAVKKELTTLYEVKEGDTLTSLARRFNTTVQRLKELNNLGEDGIEIEQMILVPNTENEGN